jgi:hypothetical protein
MRAALPLFLGLALFAGTALAGMPEDGQAVTILRGSSAPPPAPPTPTDEPTIVQREVVYAPYPVYAWPDFVVPGFIVANRHRPFHITTTPLPNGWPLFQSTPRLQSTPRR